MQCFSLWNDFSSSLPTSGDIGEGSPSKHHHHSSDANILRQLSGGVEGARRRRTRVVSCSLGKTRLNFYSNKAAPIYGNIRHFANALLMGAFAHLLQKFTFRSRYLLLGRKQYFVHLVNQGSKTGSHILNLMEFKTVRTMN